MSSQEPRQVFQKPLMIFDGDCGFCRRWIGRWKAWTGARVDYAPFQEVGKRFPQIPPEAFAEAVQLVDVDGKVYSGAEAAFRTLATVPGKGTLLGLYRYLPGFRAISEWAYRRVARHRGFFSNLTRWFLGKDLQPSTYFFTRKLFLSGLGLVYFIAFLSLAVQIKGLVGSDGILPAAEFLNRVKEGLGEGAFWRLPTLFWFHAGNGALLGICWGGVLLSVLLMLGVAPLPVLVLLWFFYLSLYNVGQVFLSFQWDILLLETGFLAVFFAPFSLNPRKAYETRPSTAVRYLLYWLLFRLMFMSGAVKLLSGDPAWRELTALQYHYQSQPLPTWIGYWVHHLPEWFHRESAWAMFAVELVIPFFIFIPGRIRKLGALFFVIFQGLIMLTGNYGYFNLLTLVLCIPLIPDQAWPAVLKRYLAPSFPSSQTGGRRLWPKWVTVPLLFVVLAVSLARMERRLGDMQFFSKYFSWLNRGTAGFPIANNYGLFAVMTKQRPEITVEGSDDGVHWKPYVFKWKAGDLKGRPRFVQPHMPRLDWQMWFAALRPPGRHPLWFEKFLERLLMGSPDVMALLKENPFPEGPPRYVRAVVSPYYFSDPKVKKLTGEWWIKGREQPYSQVYSMPSGFPER